MMRPVIYDGNREYVKKAIDMESSILAVTRVNAGTQGTLGNLRNMQAEAFTDDGDSWADEWEEATATLRRT